jgi:hypothetical protein
MREGKVLDALRRKGDAGSTAPDLVPDAYDDTPPMMWPFAALSLAAHLIKLEREGRVRAAESARYIAVS